MNNSNLAYIDEHKNKLKEKMTDMDNAERLIKKYQNQILYNHESKRWYLWNGKYWEIDNKGTINKYAQATVIEMEEKELPKIPMNQEKDFKKFIKQSKGQGKLAAMIKLAQPKVPALMGDFDKNIWLFNVQNGTVDLRTGELLPHNPSDLITKISPVVYDADAKCPKWEDFLNRIFEGNQATIEYIQKAIGYSLTGDTKEQCFFICSGNGANGKSTMLNICEIMLNNYSMHSSVDTFMAKRSRGIPNDIAALKDARMVTTTETEEEQRLGESKIKELTGNDTIQARFLFGEYFNFKPQFKIWMATNYKPKINGCDVGIWRRIKLIPFNVSIPADEQDSELTNKLKDELSGIFNWALLGCMVWQSEGLNTPQTIIDAVDQYKKEMDILGNFITSCCQTDNTEKETHGDLWKAYQAYCNENCESTCGKKEFSRRMQLKGFEKHNGTGNKLYWNGIKLIS